MKTPRTLEEQIEDIKKLLYEGPEVETRILVYARLQSIPGKELLGSLVNKGILNRWKTRSPYSNRPCTMYQLGHSPEDESIEAYPTTR